MKKIKTTEIKKMLLFYQKSGGVEDINIAYVNSNNNNDAAIVKGSSSNHH